MQGGGSLVPIFDFSTANVFTKKLAFDIHYDTGADGTKTNPHVDVPIFSLGGLPFRVFVDASNMKEFPQAINMSLAENSEDLLASGWDIGVERSFTSEKFVGEAEVYGNMKTSLQDFGKKTVALTVFKGSPKRYTFDMSLEFQDVFPYRLRFKNATSAKESFSDCRIILEGKEDSPVFVNRIFLAMASPFFRTLFFEDFKEKNEDTIRLSDATEEEFLEYLYCVYFPNRPFAFKRLNTLLRLADKYQNDVLMASMQKFLLNKTKTPLSTEEKHKMLAWGDAYRMPALFRETLEKMDKSDLKTLEKDVHDRFSRENAGLLIDRFIHEC